MVILYMRPPTHTHGELMSDVQHLSQYLATNILELRRKQNLSQNQLAKLSEIPRSTLTHLESGAGNPSLQNMARLAAALGVSIEELVSRPREDCQHLSAAEIPVKSRRGGQALFHKLLREFFLQRARRVCFS